MPLVLHSNRGFFYFIITPFIIAYLIQLLELFIDHTFSLVDVLAAFILAPIIFFLIIFLISGSLKDIIIDETSLRVSYYHFKKLRPNIVIKSSNINKIIVMKYSLPGYNTPILRIEYLENGKVRKRRLEFINYNVDKVITFIEGVKNLGINIKIEGDFFKKKA